ncbi:hypothetical protein LUZ60_013285 [Juncus effusus]|nr:hypothetical protein LUZ60_013285 [Juncus effusus]
MIQKDSRPDVVTYTYTSIINCFLADGQWKGAIRIFSEMINNGVKPNVVTLNSLIDFLCKNGQIEANKNCLRFMVERDEKPDVHSAYLRRVFQ